MKRFPYITPYVNELFERELERIDYIFLRPILVVLYFFIRLIIFPLKFLIHRRALGFETYCIDAILCFGIKYLASEDAIRLIIRHVQIEPLLYRFLLAGTKEAKHPDERPMFQGIDGDFSVNTTRDVIRHGLTIAHDDLSYEITERFDKDEFLSNLSWYRTHSPEDHEQFGKEILALNKKYSLQLLGCTNVVILIVITITIFGDLKSIVRALNSFGSDSILLWSLKNIYADNPQVMIDLDFYLQTSHNRSHYNSSPFFSDPSQYLYYHIAFDEYAYARLREHTAPRLSE